MCDKITTSIISGSFLLLGAVIGATIPLLIFRMNIRHQKFVLYREKYEEMSLIFLQFLEGTILMNRATSKNEIESPEFLNHMRRVQDLCLLYFEDLSESFDPVIDAQMKLYSYYLHSFDDSSELNASDQALQTKIGKQCLDEFQSAKIEFEKNMFSKEFKKEYLKA